MKLAQTTSCSAQFLHSWVPLRRETSETGSEALYFALHGRLQRSPALLLLHLDEPRNPFQPFVPAQAPIGPGAELRSAMRSAMQR